MLLVFLISFLSICYQIVLKNVVIDMFNVRAEWVDKTRTSPTDLPSIDWITKYPFKEEPTYKQVNLWENDAQDSGGRIERIFSQFESYCSDWFMLRNSCENISKRFKKLLGMNLTTASNGNLVFRLEDGRYTTEQPYYDVTAEATNTKAFCRYLQERGSQYCYVLVPSPVDEMQETDLAARGYRAAANEIANDFLRQLQTDDVNVLDLRAVLHEENISYSQVFYRGDHHWMPEYGFWAAGQISSKIEALTEYHADPEVFYLENYQREISEGVFTGSQTRMMYPFLVEKDSMEYWYPRFETAFEKTVPSLGLNLSGSFDEVMYSRDKWPDYLIWNHGIQAVKTYRNLTNPTTNLRILLLTDSYSGVVSPFLACAYPEIREIDLRFFNGSLETYIEEYDPDLVVSIYSAWCFDGDTKTLWSFE